MTSPKRILFSPFTRVEGDLRLDVELAGGEVTTARASGTLYRGFEEMLRGREPRDAIVILCRICGQCGAAHSAACAAALADAWGAERPRNAVLATAIIQATEVILNHMAHFWFTFAGDLCRLPGGEGLEARFAPIKGSSFQRALGVRHCLLGLMGLMAGKWPNSLAIQPGGVTRALSRGDLIRTRGILGEFARRLEVELLGCPLERWLEVRSLADLDRWLGEADHEASDPGAFVSTALRCGLGMIGRGPGRFLSAGGLALPDGQTWLRPGYWDGGASPLDVGQIGEDVAFSWFDSEQSDAHPADSDAVPAPEKSGAYSWSKAPRYGGRSVEVGPMARMVVDGDPLARDLLAKVGPSVFARVLLRLHEIARLTSSLDEWLGQIDPDEPFYVEPQRPESARGFALTEAPRGMLGHWVHIEQGRIRGYQVVTPTSWNLSPRDGTGQPGPLEEALVGTPVEDPESAVNVALVVRSYDPCLYCSVH